MHGSIFDQKAWYAKDNQGDLSEYDFNGQCTFSPDIGDLNTCKYITSHESSASYTVTYNYSTNGGSSATKTTATAKKGEAIDLTPTATKSGWTFVGWNTDPNANTELTSLKIESLNVTLYAIYKKTLTATFYFGSSGASNLVSVVIYNNNAATGSVQAPSLTPWDGWTSVGWTTSTTKFSDAPDIQVGSSITICADKSYYDMYSKEITISYDTNGGSGTAPASQTEKRYANAHGSGSSDIGYKSVQFTLAGGTGLSRTGYTFGGWLVGSTGGSTSGAGATIFSNVSTTCYAKWTANKYTVTFNANGRTVSPSSQTVTFGGKYDNLPRPPGAAIPSKGGIRWLTAAPWWKKGLR